MHELGLPLPRVKSPPWHMNCVMTRWKEEPLKWSGLPERPVPAGKGTVDTRSMTDTRFERVTFRTGI